MSFQSLFVCGSYLGGGTHSPIMLCNILPECHEAAGGSGNPPGGVPDRAYPPVGGPGTPPGGVPGQDSILLQIRTTISQVPLPGKGPKVPFPGGSGYPPGGVYAVPRNF